MTKRWVREVQVRAEPSVAAWLLRRVCSGLGHADAHIALAASTLEPVPGEVRAYRSGQGVCTRCGSFLIIEELD